MIRLLATDLDGTFIDKNKNISDTNINAIKKAKENGVTTAICTGRTMSEIKLIPQFETVSPHIDYIIYENGASCKDNKRNEIIFSHSLDNDEIEYIYNSLEKFDKMFEVYTGGNVHCNEEIMLDDEYKKYISPDFHELVEDTRVKVKNVVEFAKNKSVQMVLVSFLSHEKSVKAYEILQKMDNYITFAGKKGLQVHNPNADKGKGISNLSKKLNIDKSQVMAIGDSHNDLPMRDATDKLIAMDNATSKLKEIADYITKTNNENGVALALDKFLG